jgi:hypothetical protein
MSAKESLSRLGPISTPSARSVGLNLIVAAPCDRTPLCYRAKVICCLVNLDAGKRKARPSIDSQVE